MDGDGERIVADAPFGVAVLDRGGRVVRTNAAFTELFGPGAVTGATFVSLVARPDRSSVQEALLSLERGRRRVSVDHRVVGASPRRCRTTLSRPERHDLITIYVEDVTERRAEARELADAARLYRAAFEGAPVGQAVCTLDGTILHANRALARLFGSDVASMVGARLHDHALDVAPIGDEDLVGLVRGTIPTLDVERRFRRADGSTMHAHVHLTLGRDVAGRPAQLLVAVTDITRRTLAEHERATALSRLEEALAELERSNADLEHFASVASHDLRSPLATIIGFLRTLEHQEKGTLSQQGRTYVGAALRGAERMERMVDALLTFARRDRAPVQLQPVDLDEVVRGAVAALSDRIAAAGAGVTVGPMPRVWSDRPSLDVVVQNLVANAIKFHRPGTAPTVQVTSERVGSDWRLVVEDDGIGVPVEQRETIFEMFARPAHVDGYDGTGIGLASVARAVGRVGGRVWVEGRRDGGPGSRFVVALPTQPAPADLQPTA